MIRKLVRRILGAGPGGHTGRSSGESAPIAVGLRAASPVTGGPYDRLLSGRSALVAGAGPNIGRGITLELARAGADLILVDRLEAPLAALRQELAVLERRVTTHVTDLTAVGEVEALIARVTTGAPNLDLLVLNAGVSELSAGAGAFDAMEHLFRTNVIGPLYLAERFAENMVAHGRAASIIFITSIHQWVLHGGPAYSASKAALGMVVRELALKLASHHIRVNAVAPGWVALGEHDAPRPHQATPLLQSSVHPSFVGAAVVHLAADSLSGKTTGATIAVDGGLSLHSYLTVPR